MSVQRWSHEHPTECIPVRYGEGDWIRYADHVAALAEAEQQFNETLNRLGKCNGCQEDLDYVRAEALREAREAVAGGFTTLANDPFISQEGRKEVDHYLTGAIEEIDALAARQAPAPLGEVT